MRAMAPDRRRTDRILFSLCIHLDLHHSLDFPDRLGDWEDTQMILGGAPPMQCALHRG